MPRRVFITLVMTLFFALSSYAADKAKLSEAFDKVEYMRDQGHSVMTITQIFDQVLANRVPQGFEPVFESTKPGFYIQEFVLKGEALSHWTQKITIAGSKGLSSNPQLKPEHLVSMVASGFKRTCPQSFRTVNLGERRVDGYDAFAAVTSCGEVPTSEGKVSEVLVQLTLKGKEDYYSFQWSERGLPSSGPLTVDPNVGNEKLNQLLPIKLCDIVPGEAKPYPSCTTQIK